MLIQFWKSKNRCQLQKRTTKEILTWGTIKKTSKTIILHLSWVSLNLYCFLKSDLPRKWPFSWTNLHSQKSSMPSRWLQVQHLESSFFFYFFPFLFAVGGQVDSRPLLRLIQKECSTFYKTRNMLGKNQKWPKAKALERIWN